MVDFKSFIDVTSRLSPGQARKILPELLNKNPNFVSFTKHSLQEMQVDYLKTGDILNVFRGGKIYEDPEFENGSYRYRVQTSKITVVIAFRSPQSVIVVTAWRKKP